MDDIAEQLKAWERDRTGQEDILLQDSAEEIKILRLRLAAMEALAASLYYGS